jgi:DNA-binding CsgD family transcriptional regulator
VHVDADRQRRVARSLAERGGLVRLARRAREELTAAGARPRRAALSGPAALTAAKHRVAALAASGHTNREIAPQLFVTQRTVEPHLSHAFDKLGVHPRDRLATALWPVDAQAREIAAGAAPPSIASPAGVDLREPSPAPTVATESTMAHAQSAPGHTAWRGPR